MSNPLLEAALAYARQGWPVFPCMGKKPLTAHGYKDATTDEAHIREWWRKWPMAQVATPTGAVTGFVVLDIDLHKGGDVGLEMLEARIGALPETRRSFTGGGGQHVLFEHPGIPIKNSAKELGSGLDVRGDGGYIVLPPSPHESGREYTWETSVDADEIPLAPLPKELLALIKAPKSSRNGQPGHGPRIPHGQRNDTLARVAGSMRAQGLTPEEMVPSLLAVNAGRCDPPFAEADVRKIAESIGRYDADQAEPILVPMSTVTPQAVQWLWHPYIPASKLSFIDGDPGLGKTWCSLTLAAAVTLGYRPMSGEVVEPGNVLYLGAEDGIADTLYPRLHAAGAEMGRVTVLRGCRKRGAEIPISFADMEAIEQALASVKPLLLICDPIQAYFGAKVDMHRANETRPILAALADLAERYHVAIIGIRHLGKGAQERAIYRALGSIDLSAAARSILLVGQNPEDPKYRRVASHLKSSLDMPGPSLEFEIREGQFRWVGESKLTADDLLASGLSRDDRDCLDEAVEFLRDALKHEPRASTALFAEAKRLEISVATLRRAKASLGVNARALHKDTGGVAEWVWELSPLHTKG